MKGIFSGPTFAGLLAVSQTAILSTAQYDIEEIMTPEKIIACCEAHWETYKSDCNGFVKAVAHELGAKLEGNANEISGHIQQLPQITSDGMTAATWASEGKLVVAGLKGEDHQPARSHGHVVVVVAGPLAHDKYPTACWGTLGSTGRKNQTLNWA